MKNLRFWAYTSAFLSLVISLAMIGLWISGVWELKVVNLNTFIGVTVSLLAIIVTLAIAWQIYNAVDMKKDIKELNDLRSQFEDHKQSFEQQMHFSKAQIYYLFGIGAFNSHSMDNSFRFLISALEHSLQTLRPMNISIYLDKMKQAANSITSNTKYDAVLYDEVKHSDETIRSLEYYELIKDRYEPIFDKFMSKVEKEE